MTKALEAFSRTSLRLACVVAARVVMAEELGDVVTERVGEGGDWTGLATVVVVGADVVDNKTLLTPVVTLWLIDWNKLDTKFSSLIKILNTIEMN